jgi:hypothetical protein
VLKKMLVAVVAAGAMSVPLAGVAWADQPDNPGSQGQGQGQGQGRPDNPGSQGNGRPDNPGSQGNGRPDNPGSQGNGRPDNPGSQGNGPGDFGGPPGAQVGGAGGYAHQDGSVPDAIESATDLGRIGPGQIVRSFTPGCDDGDATVPCAEASTSN